MQTELKIAGLNEVLRRMQKLPPELVSNGARSPAAVAVRKAMARVLRAVRRNAQQAINAPGSSGLTRSTGFTAKAIVSKRRKPPKGQRGEYRVITIKQDPHPLGGRKYRGRPIRANDVAFILEMGTATQAGIPYMRPAFEETAADAILSVESEMLRELEKVVRKLGGK
jgi:hypothetical protein